jgi:predicted transcriptional regulator
MITMKCSKLEKNIDILKVLAHKGPLKLTHIMYTSNVNCSELKENLGFLLKQGLVEKRTPDKTHAIFEVSQRGIAVLKYFGGLKQVPPIVEETTKKATPF